MGVPNHYQGKDGIQPFDIIDAFDLGFNLGNVIKYVCRADKKGERLSDLRKAMTYLQREIASAGMPPTVKPLYVHTYEPMLSRDGDVELCRRCGQSKDHGLHPSNPYADHHFEPSQNHGGEYCRVCGNPENYRLHPVVVTREELVPPNRETLAEQASRIQRRNDEINLNQADVDQWHRNDEADDA